VEDAGLDNVIVADRFGSLVDCRWLAPQPASELTFADTDVKNDLSRKRDSNFGTGMYRTIWPIATAMALTTTPSAIPVAFTNKNAHSRTTIRVLSVPPVL
jgi:hypothetical protein